MARGRKPGRSLGDIELRHLRHLLQTRDTGKRNEAHYAEELEDYVLELRESGASARGIAERLGVSSSAVQTWTKNARRRRGH